jgi:hypothetical protein
MLRSFVVFATVLFALLVPNLEAILAIAGAVGSVAGLVCPTLFLIALKGQAGRTAWTDVLAHALALCAGVAVLVCGCVGFGRTF